MENTNVVESLTTEVISSENDDLGATAAKHNFNETQDIENDLTCSGDVNNVLNEMLTQIGQTNENDLLNPYENIRFTDGKYAILKTFISIILP